MKVVSALVTCTAVLLCGILVSACVDAGVTKQSTDTIIQNQKETQTQEATEEKKETEQPTVVNNYIDNSTTNIDNSVTNIDNSTTNIDNSITNNYSTVVIGDNKYDENETATPKKVDEDDNETCVNVGNNRLIPVGDEKDDIDPNPNVVLIKNATCPKCGQNSYIEQYNKHDTYFQHYIGMCTACNFEY